MAMELKGRRRWLARNMNKLDLVATYLDEGRF
jgi:hypothetical protein